VLRFSGEAKGDWAPEIPAETLRGALRDIALTRAMDERMFNMQRQGKMSFYMKSTGEEAVTANLFPFSILLRNTAFFLSRAISARS